MKSTGILSLVGLFVCLGACAPAAEEAPTTEADVAAINSVREQEIEAGRAGDVELFLALLTEDAVYLPPNEPVLKGKAAINRGCRTSWMSLLWRVLTLPQTLWFRVTGRSSTTL